MISTENIIQILSILGIGGIIGGIITTFSQYVSERKNSVAEKEHEFKRKRYSAITILLLTLLKPSDRLQKLTQNRPDIKTIDDLEEEIRVEILNSLLYANDDVVKSLIIFQKHVSKDNYFKVLTTMRKDLWNSTTNIDTNILGSLSTGVTLKTELNGRTREIDI